MKYNAPILKSSTLALKVAKWLLFFLISFNVHSAFSQTISEYNETFKKAPFSLYPNPAHGEVKAQFDLLSDTAEILLYDLTGKQLMRYAALNKKGSITLNIAALASGIYVVVLKEDGQITLQKKLIIK